MTHLPRATHFALRHFALRTCKAWRIPVRHRRGARFTLSLDMVRGELLCDEAAVMRRRIVRSVPHTTYFA
jgi:hypothetical protein